MRSNFDDLICSVQLMFAIVDTVHRWFLASRRSSLNGGRAAERSSRCIDHRVYIWHSHSRAARRAGNTFHDVSAGHSESRWPLSYPRVCSGPCTRIDADSWWILGKPPRPARSSHLLCLVTGKEMHDSLPGILVVLLYSYVWIYF